jgi:diguanylate cyclase (GGDEF)-like protein
MAREPSRTNGPQPRIAELVDIDRRAGRDLAWIVVASVVLCAVSLWLGAVDKAIDVSASLETWNLNGLVPLLIISPLGGAFYAWRRHHEGLSAQRELAYLTVHDSLTGLPNRRFLGESFRRMLEEHRREMGHIAVLFVDLDRFKNVNDTYGHEAGDRLMQAVAERLRTAVKAEDVVIRYAGDEFVLAISAVPSAAVAERIASRIIKVLETPFEMGQDRIQISASIGIALTEDKVCSPDEVIRDADAAMYQAKAHGSGTYAVFDRSMRDRLTPSTAERRLREAIDRGEFQVRYQPVVSLWTRRLVAVEARLRWQDPARGVIDPADFVPALEDTGLIVPVGRWLLREACAQSRAWTVQHPDRPPLQVTIAVSPRELSQSDFVEQLHLAIVDTGAHAETIVVEIDERALLGDLGLLRQTLRAVRRLGVRIGLDDFGAGLGSLGHLRNFEIDVLKIDQSYVTSLTESQRDQAVVEHVIGLAKALGIVTLASGVDSPSQVERLSTLGCDLAMGPYFASPQPATVIGELLATPAVAPAPITTTVVAPVATSPVGTGTALAEAPTVLPNLRRS